MRRRISIAVGAVVCSAIAASRLLLRFDGDLLSQRFFFARAKRVGLKGLPGESTPFSMTSDVLHERLDALALVRTKQGVLSPPRRAFFHLLRLLLESPRTPPLADLHSFSQ
ncbi:hypothetical protein DFH06DRAFT_1340284 [Mycena polygramma]|nr:hypothetical protein DFH06DRAFT_1340284 [Mycena polygramma]